ncbi:MAG: 16S rRNA (guanine(527)-N(7))-methyltransferase RsmG [Thioalkalispiraceae bacterium]|jgi:16S rRNA (guanine527-N7)-methyltransferase
MHEQLSKQLQQGIAALGLEVDEAKQSALLDYVALLHKWNRAYNLTAVRKPELMITRHLLDSLVIHPFLKPGRILDVGTGAGLPGIPLALIRPEDVFYLLDSNSKKTRFITQAVAELGLQNVSVVQSRVEDYKTNTTFDTIISRAYSTLANMVAGTRHLLAKNGVFFAMKGVFPVAEVDELPVDAELLESHALHIPGLDAERHLLVLKLREQ